MRLCIVLEDCIFIQTYSNYKIFKMKLVFIICLVYECYSVNGVPTIEVSSSAETIAQGGDVSITCKISEFPGGSTLVSWYKRQGGEHQVQMGTNDELSDTFTDTGRYTTSKETADDTTKYVIIIKEAKAEDSGEIGCEIKSLNVALKFTSMQVLVPVQAIHLYGLNENGEDVKEYSDGDEIVFQEGDKFYFRCEASGSNPEPKFDITLNSESVMDKFEQENTYKIEGGQPGLKQVEHLGKATTTSPIIINKDHNSVPFKCSASVNNTAFKSIIVTPSMSFAPHITCEKYDYALPVFSINLQVDCRVKSDPRTDDIYLFWKNIHGENNTLRDDDEYGHYRMTVSNGDTPDEQKVTFIVDRIGPQGFRTYTLYARNAEGLSDKDIKITRDYSQENSSTTLSSFSVVTILLVSYAVTFV